MSCRGGTRSTTGVIRGRTAAMSPPTHCAMPGLEAELQLDRLKPKLSRRVLLLQDHQSSWHRVLDLAPGTPPLCHNLTAYLRVRGRCQHGLARVGMVASPAQGGWGTGMGTVVSPAGMGTRLGTVVSPARVGGSGVPSGVLCPWVPPG